MIIVRNLRKSFSNHSVLRGIDLEVGRETLGLLGANGSGKTTLLKCLLGVLDFEGEIRVADFDIRKNPIEAKRRMAYVPQSFPLWGEIKVNDCMRFFCKLRKVAETRGHDLLEEFDLDQFKKKTVQTLSGGMKQKLSIAIALLSDPEVVLLDEPTASLDAWATNEIISILKSWRGNKTIILSSHRLEEVQAVSDRLIEIKDGTLVRPDLERLNLSKRASCE